MGDFLYICNMDNKVTYHHIRRDTNEVFYVGIGDPTRPYVDESRNPHWHHIVNKVGYDVLVINENLSWEDACEWEISEIKKIGRRDLGLGPLVNLTDGGEGIKNMSPESRDKISQKMVGTSNHRFGKYGPEASNSKLSQEDAEIIRKIFIPHSTEFGIRALSKKYKVDRGTIKKIVSGKSYKGIGGDIIEYQDKTVGIGTSGKFKDEDIKWIRTHYQSHHPEFGSTAMANKFNTNTSRIWKIINYKTHKNIKVKTQNKKIISPKNAKFLDEEIRIIRTLSCNEAVKRFNLSRSTYYRIIKRIHYKHVQ